MTYLSDFYSTIKRDRLHVGYDGTPYVYLADVSDEDGNSLGMIVRNNRNGVVLRVTPSSMTFIRKMPKYA